MSWLAGLAAVGCAAVWGGWEWALICGVVLVAQRRLDAGFPSLLYTVAGGFFWLAMFRWTGDRRMFFPYSMQYAVQMACLTRGGLGGWVVVGVFLSIRISQAASASVLLVELAVAAVVLVLSASLHGQGMRGAKARAVAGAVGSVLAFAGLVF